MKDHVRVSAVQLDVKWLDPERNLENMRRFVVEEAEQGEADLIVFPELSNLGYVTGRDKSFSSRYMALAEPIPGPTTDGLGELASRYNVHIIVGMAHRHPEVAGCIFNSAVLIGPTGEVVGVYPKMHISAEEKHYFVPGNHAHVYQTPIGNIGLVICYDAMFPELPRALTLKGAEILCCIFNSPKLGQYVAERYAYLASIRAWENKAFVICLNRVGEQAGWTFLGHSAMASPSGEVLAQSRSEEEEVLRATFHSELILEERAYLTIFRDRRPDQYDALVQPVFPEELALHSHAGQANGSSAERVTSKDSRTRQSAAD